MIDNWIKKGLAFAVVLLFIGVSFQSIIAEKTISVEKESDYNNVDFEQAKEYLFQIIIDISNNPEVKQFLNEHKHDLITRDNNNYEYKNVIQKICSQNPKLLKSILFNKPKMTYEYLETNYNKGLELYNILWEEESLKIVESVKIANPELFNELKVIISNDKELSIKISNLKEMNNNIKSNLDLWAFPIICSILFILILILWPIVISNEIFHRLTELADLFNHPLLAKFFKFFYDLTFVILHPILTPIYSLWFYLCYTIYP